MNTSNEEHKDEYKENLLISENIKNLDINLTPRSNFELLKKYFPIVIIILLLLLSYFLYYLSLEPCFGGFDTCVFKKPWIKSKFIEAILSIIIKTILFELMIFKKISKLHLIHFFIAYYFLCRHCHGYDFDDHGLFMFFFSFIYNFINFMSNEWLYIFI